MSYEQIQNLKDRMQRSIIGQEVVVERMIIGLLANVLAVTVYRYRVAARRRLAIESYSTRPPAQLHRLATQATRV